MKISKSEFINKIMNSKFFGSFATLLAGLTLEIYITQFFLIDKTLKLNLIFPLNLFIFLISLLTVSFLLNKISRIQ